MKFIKIMDYVACLFTDLRKYKKLPPLSLSQIEADKDIITELKPVFKLIYKHVDLENENGPCLEPLELERIKNFVTPTAELNILLLMAFFGHIQYFDYLLSIGYDKNVTTSIAEANALHIAIHAGELKMFEHLLKLGYDKNSVCMNGMNALHLASF